jgi:hypothetical protein
MNDLNTVDETTPVGDEGSSFGFLKRDDSAGPYVWFQNWAGSDAHA